METKHLIDISSSAPLLSRGPATNAAPVSMVCFNRGYSPLFSKAITLMALATIMNETGHAKHSFFAQGYVGMQIPASYADGVSADEGREIDIDTVCKFFPGIRNVQIPYVCMIRKAVIDNNRPVTPLRILTPEYRQFVKDNSAFIPSVIASGRDAFYAMPASLRLNELQLLVHVVASTFDRYINKGGIAIDVCRQTSISDTMIATLKKAYDKYAGFSHYRQVYHIAQSYCKTPLVNEIFKKLQNVPVS